MNSLTFCPNLATERLVLRQLETEDDNEIFFLRSDERVLQYLIITKATCIEDAREFINKINTGIINNESAYWGITSKNDNTLIGTICLWNYSKEDNKVEIGYVLHPDFQGQGIMQEAISKVIEYGFEIMELRSMEAVLHPDNARSLALLKRNGFVYEKESGDAVVYKLLNQGNKSKP